MEKKIVEIQDSDGNVYYPHTKSEAVFLSDGKTLSAWKSNIEKSISEKASKDRQVSATIEFSKWQGTDAPYINTVSVKGLTGNSSEIVEILVPYTATDEQKLSWGEAGILSGDNIKDGIILQAYGEKPTIDIPLILIIRGD